MGFFGQAMGNIGGCSVNPLGTNTSQGALSSSGIGGTTSSSSNCAPTGLNSSSDAPTPTGGTPPTDPNATTGGAPTTGLNGQTFGGAGIMGFSPNSPKQSIMIYKTKNRYNEWEFVYDPIVEQMMLTGGGPTGPTTTPTTPTTTTPTTTTTIPTTP
jgi:hypothetical protein